MSLESLKEYGRLCAENEEVRKKAKEIGLQDIEAHIAHGHSLGLEFSKEDFRAFAEEAGLDGKNELSEEELKKVAGGCGTLTSLAVMLVASAVVTGAGMAAGLTKPRW
jgi:predicted ribosomally synthesized peptide with nif11-like leader